MSTIRELVQHGCFNHYRCWSRNQENNKVIPQNYIEKASINPPPTVDIFAEFKKNGNAREPSEQNVTCSQSYS